jgi:hypothetical protein
MMVNHPYTTMIIAKQRQRELLDEAAKWRRYGRGRPRRRS